MKVHFLSENALEALRANLQGNLRHYADDTNEWIYDYFEGESPFIEYKQEFPDFNLTFDHERSLGNIDVDNAITLYSAMKALTDAEATEERLWVGMSHCDFWDFLKNRWHNNDINTLNEANIRARYFFGHGKTRSLIVNSLSKLWWLGRLTYDEKRKDPFELTKYFKTDFPSKTLFIFSHNYTNNKEITKGIISALKKLEDAEYQIKSETNRAVFREVIKYLNVLSGTYILDYFSSEEIEEKIIRHMETIKGASTSSALLSMGV